MSSLTVRRFLVTILAIVLTLSLGVFAIPALPVEAQSAGNANVKFSTGYSYTVSGDTFTNGGPVNTGNENWGSNLNLNATPSLDNVTLNLASSLSFNNENPTPNTMGPPNYMWSFGTLSAVGNASANVGLNNIPSPGTFTPGFDASRSVDNTTFTASGTQTLTVSVTPKETITTGEGIGIGVNLPENQYVNATIESVAASPGAPTNNINYSPDGSNLNININSPVEGQEYTYTIQISLTLQGGIAQLDYMPNVNVGTNQSVASGSVSGTYVTSPTTGAGTWTWSSTDDITWNWNEGVSQGINFQGYANAPSANVNFSTGYSYTVSGDTFTNGGPVNTGNENWGSNLNLNGIPSLDSVNLNLASATSFNNENPTPNKMGPPNYMWSFGTLSAEGNASANVGLNNIPSPGTFTPGFDASRSVDNTAFTASGTQTLTVSVTPRGTITEGEGIGIGVNLPENQYVNATIESVVASPGAPTNNINYSPDGSNLNININNPTTGIAYTYTITIQLNLLQAVTENYMPGVNVGANQSVASGSFTGTSFDHSNGAGTWTWSSTDSITWNWNEGVSQGVNFQGYANPTSANVVFMTHDMYVISGDSFTNAPVTGNVACTSGVIGSSTSLNNVNLNLAGSTSFDNENPAPTSISGSDYQWDFGTVSAGGIVMAGVELNNSSGSFTPGFDASRSVNPTTFTASGTQLLTVNVTPEETLPGGISISVNVPEDQYVNVTIGSAVTSPNGAPLNDINTTPMNGESSMIIGIDSASIGITYTYEIPIQVNLQPGVAQLEYMPVVYVSTNQPGTNGSGTYAGTSFTGPATGAGTWTWSSTDPIIWNWMDILAQGVYFLPHEAATMTTATNISSGGAASVPVQTDGVAVGITGSTAPSGTGVTISSTSDGSTQPSGTGTIGLTGSPQYYGPIEVTDSPQYYDVNVSSPSGLGADAMAEVSITSPFVTAASTMQYWYNGIWNGANDISVSGTTITGEIPVAALGGTPVAIGDGPSITISTPVNGAVYYLNQAVTANWSVTGGQKGIASASGTVPSGSLINTSKVGSYSFTVSATDGAGNTATSTVNYSVCSNAITALSGNINIGNSTNVTSSAGLSIGGNLLANGNISLGNTIKINGNARASGSITKGNNDVISGTVKPNAGVINFSIVNTAPYLANVQLPKGGTVVQGASYANGGTISNTETLIQGNLSLNNGKTLTVNGNLYVGSGSITLGNSSTLIVNGSLYITAGSLTTGNSSKITVTGTVYVSGNLQTGNSATMSLGTVVWVGGGITLGNSSNLSGPQTIVAYGNIVFGNSDVIGNPQTSLIISINGGISLGNSDQLSGYLYAPTAGASIGNSNNITGSIIATSVTIGNSCLITYGGN